jgi:hypothetical protein
MSNDKEALDDIRAEFRKHGWAIHMLTDAGLLDTVRSALTRYDEMQTAINGMAETVQGLREANAAGQARAVASRPEPACSAIGGTP